MIDIMFKIHDVPKNAIFFHKLSLAFHDNLSEINQYN